MNKKAAAEYLNVSERAVERYVAQGKLSVRYQKGARGKAAVYDESELRKVKAVLDNERGLIRAATVLPDKHDHEARQLARLSDIRGDIDLFAVLAHLASDAKKTRTTEHSPSELVAKHFLTVDEAALLAGLSRDHIREALKAKKLKGKIIGRGWKIKPKDLQNYTDKL
jgi:excisionase family DNA binding protein